MDAIEIKPGDMLFVWGKSLIDDAIEWVTQGPSHCALCVDSETLVEAQGGRLIGTASLSGYLSTYDRLEVWRDESLSDEERQRIITYAYSQFGLPYDYLGILMELARFEFHLPINSFHEGKRRICSSFVYDCAKSVGRTWANVSVPAPVDLLEGGKLTKKGALSCPNTPIQSV